MSSSIDNIDWSSQRPCIVEALRPVLALATSFGDQKALFAIQRLADAGRCLKMTTVDQVKYLEEDLANFTHHGEEYLSLLRQGLQGLARKNEKIMS